MRKICPGCKLEKPLTEYSPSTSRCKPCNAEAKHLWRVNNPEKKKIIDKRNYVRRREERLAYAKEYRQANKEEVNAAERLRSAINYKNNAEFIDGYKSAPCIDCNNSFPPECMQFDHIDPSTKVMPVSRMKTCRSFESILKEIQKCELVCANCHAIRTRRRSDLLGAEGRKQLRKYGKTKI